MKNVSRPSNPPDELAQHVSKKPFSDELFLLFCFESSEYHRLFNCLHDSNSIFSGRENEFRDIFRARGTLEGLARMASDDAQEVAEVVV